METAWKQLNVSPVWVGQRERNLANERRNRQKWRKGCNEDSVSYETLSLRSKGNVTVINQMDDKVTKGWERSVGWEAPMLRVA